MIFLDVLAFFFCILDLLAPACSRPLHPLFPTSCMHAARALLTSHFLFNHYSHASGVISFFYGCLLALCLLLSSLHYFRHGAGHAGHSHRRRCGAGWRWRCGGEARTTGGRRHRCAEVQDIDAAAVVVKLAQQVDIAAVCAEVQDIDAAAIVQEVDAAVVVDAANSYTSTMPCKNIWPLRIELRTSSFSFACDGHSNQEQVVVWCASKPYLLGVK